MENEIKKGTVYIDKFEKLFENAVKKCIPKGKFGVIFSGGIDSTTITLMCKKLGTKPILYTTSVSAGTYVPKDVVAAQQVAKALGFKLRIVKIKITNIENYLKKVIPIIKTTDVVQVGVGLVIYTALERAKRDGIKVVLSGAGSDELFAGYSRFRKTTDLNADSKMALHKLMLTDLKRDKKIAKAIGIKLKNPFLDKRIINFAFQLPDELKFYNNHTKAIVRALAIRLGLPKEFAFRKKCAAQYGSGFDYAIEKLAKRAGFKLKSAYLYQFYKKPNLKVAVLFSSGKDSTYAMHILKNQNYEISCLITIKSENPDSYMYHTPNISFTKLQAEALGIPVILRKTKGEKEKEIKDLERAIKEAIKKYSIKGVVCGAIASSYQRDRIQKICEKLKLRLFAPLWHKDQEKEVQECIRAGIKFIIVKVAAQGLDKSWLGKEITFENVGELIELCRKFGINIAGEGGEYETLVLDAPMFNKKIEILDYEIKESQNVAQLVVKDAKLVEK